jgi:hypothetical protein
MKKDKRIYDCKLSDREIKALARCFLPAVQEFYESEDGRVAFKEWEREQSKKRNPANAETKKEGNDGQDDS